MLKKEKLHKFEKMVSDERGAAPIVEMSFIFPLVVMVIGFLIYVSCYILQGITMYTEAQRVAVAASREISYPGYEKLYGTEGVTAKADLNMAFGTPIVSSTIAEMMKGKDPYRYWGNIYTGTKKDVLTASLKKMIESTSFITQSDVTCNITAENHILYQEVTVTAVKKVAAPEILRLLGITQDLDITVNAVAVVSDTSEFIRNTDMVFDITNYLVNDLKLGGSTISEKINGYKQKIVDIKARLKWG